MNTKDFVFGVLVTLTIVLASLSVVEYNQASDLGAQLQSKSQVVTTLQTYTTLQTTTYQPLSITTQTVVVTKTIYNPNAGYTWYVAPSVALPVSWPGVLPTDTVVGTGSEQDYGFNLIVVPPIPCACPANSTCSCTIRIPQVDFDVSQWPNPSGYEWANFTWRGLSTVPSPSSASLFGGSVAMQWYVSSSLLYLNITVK